MKKRPSVRFWAALVFVFVLLLLFINPMTLWVMVSPRYSEGALRGCTVPEVIEKLGPPDYDPRQHGWNYEDEDGPFVLGYRGGWAVCRIEFKDGVVVRVERYGK